MRVNIKVVCDPFTLLLTSHRGFTGGLDSKESACHAGDLGFIPGSGRSPGEGNGNLLQYSCLENSMDRGAWWAIVHGAAKNWTQLSDFRFHSPPPNSYVETLTYNMTCLEMEL